MTLILSVKIMSQKERENFYRQTTRIVDHSRDTVVSLIELYVRRNHISFEVFINTNQHAIFHLCFNKKPCCQCVSRQDFVFKSKSRYK